MTVPFQRIQENGSGRWGLKASRIISLLQKKPRGYKNYLLSTFSERLHLARSLGNPVSITLEPTNICNLKCPVCETGAGILERKPQTMSYENFVRIMDKVGPGANHLMLYYMGELFLNKDAYRMIRYARDMGLYVTTCTNGEYVNPEALYESGINHISFQIGGMTQETHQVYRRNSDLPKVLLNLKTYLRIIRNSGTKIGDHIVELGLIVMKHNEKEIGHFLRFGQELEVRTTLISPCVRTPEQGREFLPKDKTYWLYDQEHFERHNQLAIKRVLPWNRCPWFYYAITIQSDGNVVPCCRDPHGKFVMGDLLSEPLQKVWNGPKFKKFRYLFSKRQGPFSFCSLCPGEGAPGLK